MTSEREELQARLHDLGRRVPTLKTEIIVGNRWLIDMARLQYDIAIYSMKMANAGHSND